MTDNPWSDLSDELERLGKVPREIGAVQVAIDPAQLGSDGGGFVDVWLQAAFAGSVTAELRIEAHEPGDAPLETEKRFRPVTLEAGEVKRVRLAFRSGSGALRQLRCIVESARPREATRVRPPWRPLDTVVQPGMPPPSTTGDVLPAGLIERLVRPLLDSSDDRGRHENTRTERAPILPGFLVSDIQRVQRRFTPESFEEVTWRRGMPPTEQRPTAEAQWQPVEELRQLASCPECGNEVDAKKASDLGMCPICGARWIES